MKEKINKREFIKYGLCGLGGMIIAPAGLITFARGSNIQAEELWKWSKEAMHYVPTGRGIKCNLCPNNCRLSEGETGDCSTKINYNGKLYTIAYGNPCSVNVDPIEKKPLYHFLPASKSFSLATAGCNLACMNCQNWSISQKSPKETKNYDLMPPQVAVYAEENACQSIAYTYSEPTAFYEYMFDAAKIAQEKNIKNVMISCGYINEQPLRKLCRHIDAANIDLKSFDNNIYMRLNAGTLRPILRTLEVLKEEGVWLEITNLIVPEWTDDMDMIKRMCDWLYTNGFDHTPLHFSRFYPTYKLKRLPSTPLSTLEKARETALNAGIKYVYIGNAPGSDAGNTMCPNCNKALIIRKGYTVLENHIKNGCCEYCGETIAGVWDNNADV